MPLTRADLGSALSSVGPSGSLSDLLTSRGGSSERCAWQEAGVRCSVKSPAASPEASGGGGFAGGSVCPGSGLMVQLILPGPNFAGTAGAAQPWPRLFHSAPQEGGVTGSHGRVRRVAGPGSDSGEPLWLTYPHTLRLHKATRISDPRRDSVR